MTMILSVVGLALLAIGLLLHIIGLSTLEWSYISYSYSESKILVGLWKTFWKHEWDDTEDTSNNNSAKMEACQAFAIIGMLLAMLGLALGFIHCLFGIMGKSKNIKLSVGALAASILAFGAILICVIIWAAAIHTDRKYFPYFNYHNVKLGYSFALSIVGGILIAIGGALVFVASKQGSS